VDAVLLQGAELFFSCEGGAGLILTCQSHLTSEKALIDTDANQDVNKQTKLYS